MFQQGHSRRTAIDNLENIFARNCVVRRITRAEASEFLLANHRLGDASCRYRYGMFVRRTSGNRESGLPEGTLVAVSEFSSARRMNDGSRSCEWIRYASLSGFRVQGGMGKMLEFFMEDVHPDDVMSYADPQSPDGGEVYGKLGFKSEGIVSKPNFTCEKFRYSK